MSLKNELERIIYNGYETSLICKPILLPSRNIAKIISAFANTNGGYLILGANFESDNIDIVGLSNDFHVDSAIIKAINLISPKPELIYEFITLADKRIFAIKVKKSKEIILFDNSKYIIENNEITKCKGEIILDKTKVFIVHGRDNLAKVETARFVESLGLKAIILHEQASSSNTIIEKIEEHSNVGFAIVLYTPCDLGKEKNDIDLSPRARQNVIFEHGYLMAKIGRKNVCALVKSQVEKPSDISGIIYIDMDDNGAWKHMLIKEMKAAGYEIDANKLYS